ncbi:CoA pyrophosphatase [bacterium]|nr:CoA pyrophosphatase [bacterium]
MTRDEIQSIERRLRDREPVLTPHEPRARAAVAMVLAPADEGARLLLIKRAEHPHDPWSGHMAFPGGRHDPGDEHLLRTALRETNEEVGLDLERHGRLVNRLDDLAAVAGGRNLDMVISPYLFLVDREHPTTIDASEVAAALWVPMRHFRDSEFHGSIRFEREGAQMDFPAFHVGDHRVWGLTYRMIRGFLDAIGQPAAGAVPPTGFGTGLAPTGDRR